MHLSFIMKQLPHFFQAILGPVEGMGRGRALIKTESAVIIE